MADFAQQLQEMIEAAVKAAINPIDEESNKAFHNFTELKSFFADTTNLVSITNDKTVFEIILEKFSTRAPIKTLKDENYKVTIYSDRNAGYALLIDKDERHYSIVWNA